MKSRTVFFTVLALAGMLLFSACGSPAATEAPAESEFYAAATEAPAATQAPLADMPMEPQSLDKSADSAGAEPAVEIADASGENIVVQNTNRKIIKNADVRLLVKDTDVAIDRTTQVIGDLGGYIISSRVWYQDYYGNNLKYSTMTLGVPVDQFERALTRLRELAIRVLDENASGEDVTDQYVDLQSQLENLEATRARIQEFLKDAKTVDEALRINQELSNIEAQIEQIKGRMNYLSDRAAFSTITVNFEPEFPILTPTPTATIAPTSTPYPTPTLVPWKPGETFSDAQRTVTVAYRGIFNFLIWLVVVILPVLLPPAIVIWVLWKVFTRKQNKPSSGSSDQSAKSE
ncbi:MAG: DUF4349 domain-containing protein [Anaerolineales bacterium]